MNGGGGGFFGAALPIVGLAVGAGVMLWGVGMIAGEMNQIAGNR